MWVVCTSEVFVLREIEVVRLTSKRALQLPPGSLAVGMLRPLGRMTFGAFSFSE